MTVRMPGLKCCVIGCKNGYYNHSQFMKDKDYKKHGGFSMYCFPLDPRLRKIWIRKVRLKRDPASSRVCVAHFSEDQFEKDVDAKMMGLTRGRKLKSGAIPDRRLNYFERKSKPENRLSKKDVNQLTAKANNVKTKLQDSSTDSLIIVVDNENESCPLVIENSKDSSDLPRPNPPQDNIEEPDKSSEPIESQSMDDQLSSQPEFSLAVTSSPKIIEEAEGNQNQHDNKLKPVGNDLDYSVEEELERMLSSPTQQSEDGGEDQSSIEDNSQCSNCCALRRENRRLKLQLSFFQSKLTHVVEIYHQAEERALSQLRNKNRQELEKCRKANEEMKYKNARYLALLRAVVAQDRYEEKVTGVNNKSYWSQQEISEAQALREISQEAYTYVKDNMNVILPDLSILEEQTTDPSNCITINDED